MPQLDAAGVLQALEAREDTPGAQDGFDAGASVLLASLPPCATPLSVGARLSWYAPVVHVKSLPSVNGADANFVVTLVDSASADRVVAAGISSWPVEEAGGDAQPICVKKLTSSHTNSSAWWPW
mmetsp:Transcript_33056/g.86697  ORF Transcript_33056/g.86697 Transcript_33056/m.86697 type:complete len:124 (+) Transcript_33056:33-404(+)